jgi:4-nitrophenyl phosphatase
MPTALRDLRALIIDMDGVLWHGEVPLPGLTDFFAVLRARGLRFVLATNNASRTPQQYVAKLARMGVTVAGEEILTSALAAASYLKEVAAPGARVYVIGEDGLREALAGAGFTLCDGEAEYVVVGMDHGLTWHKLAQATLNIRAGAVFIGANPDLTLPTERGVVHGNGAILVALQAASGVAPIIMGKPEPRLYRQALARLGTAAACTAALGDRLETDILGAARAGLPAIFVLSGVSTRAELAASPYQPDWVFEGIEELTEALR